MTVLEGVPAPAAVIYDLLRIARDNYEIETRTEMRYAFCRLASIRLGDVRYPGMSREISASGIGLMHPEALPLEEAEICLRVEGNDVSLRVQIQWCKPLGEGWYISGGTFIDLADL